MKFRFLDFATITSSVVLYCDQPVRVYHFGCIYIHFGLPSGVEIDISTMERTLVSPTMDASKTISRVAAAIGSVVTGLFDGVKDMAVTRPSTRDTATSRNILATIDHGLPH